jgi:putative oxidoreductase
MDQMLFNLLKTDAPAPTLVIRLLAGAVFFAEGIKKFMFPADWGVGRFEKIGIIFPGLSAPFVGVVETVCGLLLIIGLFTRPAALLLLINISVALLTTKLPIMMHKGFWPAEAEARADYSMFMSTLFLTIVGGGVMSLDAWYVKKRNGLAKRAQQRRSFGE